MFFHRSCQRHTHCPESLDLHLSSSLQKIMHTRKRHQDMFQDLNRKLQHAEKDKESPTTDSKVGHHPPFRESCPLGGGAEGRITSAQAPNGSSRISACLSPQQGTVTSGIAPLFPLGKSRIPRTDNWMRPPKGPFGGSSCVVCVSYPFTCYVFERNYFEWLPHKDCAYVL